MEEGWGPQEVAEAIGVHVSSVCRWSDAFDRGGWEALLPAPVSGRLAKLTARQEAAVARWVHYTWPAIKRGPTWQGPPSCFPMKRG